MGVAQIHTITRLMGRLFIPSGGGRQWSHRRRRTRMWSPRSLTTGKPFYLALADALEEDVDRGRLRPGTRLPPQRSLAKKLGVDFTTISRAYAEAQRRGLVAAHVGRGTFVRRIDG